jgi:hypothetical protein
MEFTAQFIEDRMRAHREWQERHADELGEEIVLEVLGAVRDLKPEGSRLRLVRCSGRHNELCGPMGSHG